MTLRIREPRMLLQLPWGSKRWLSRQMTVSGATPDTFEILSKRGREMIEEAKSENAPSFFLPPGGSSYCRTRPR
eukprot:NODE_13071_length_250_cov_2.184615.p1 GENE.NODE_13071_length_250_cov_2.184615~~NODE_13071_length_250_cov_2.184615.p1  ORF type:complete len:74 (-),score=5.20 NODE_13071_length_250_cov_2.184615:28-249(-)